MSHSQSLTSINHGLNVTVHLSIVTDHVHPFIATVYHLLMVIFSRIMLHVTKYKSHEHDMSSERH